MRSFILAEINFLPQDAARSPVPLPAPASAGSPVPLAVPWAVPLAMTACCVLLACCRCRLLALGLCSPLPVFCLATPATCRCALQRKETRGGEAHPQPHKENPAPAFLPRPCAASPPAQPSVSPEKGWDAATCLRPELRAASSDLPACPQVPAPSHGGVTWVTMTLLLFAGAHPSCPMCRGTAPGTHGQKPACGTKPSRLLAARSFHPCSNAPRRDPTPVPAPTPRCRVSCWRDPSACPPTSCQPCTKAGEKGAARTTLAPGKQGTHSRERRELKSRHGSRPTRMRPLRLSGGSSLCATLELPGHRVPFAG